MGRGMMFKLVYGFLLILNVALATRTTTISLSSSQSESLLMLTNYTTGIEPAVFMEKQDIRIFVKSILYDRLVSRFNASDNGSLAVRVFTHTTVMTCEELSSDLTTNEIIFSSSTFGTTMEDYQTTDSVAFFTFEAPVNSKEFTVCLRHSSTVRNGVLPHTLWFPVCPEGDGCFGSDPSEYPKIFKSQTVETSLTVVTPTVGQNAIILINNPQTELGLSRPFNFSHPSLDDVKLVASGRPCSLETLNSDLYNGTSKINTDGTWLSSFTKPTVTYPGVIGTRWYNPILDPDSTSYTGDSATAEAVIYIELPSEVGMYDVCISTQDYRQYLKSLSPGIELPVWTKIGQPIKVLEEPTEASLFDNCGGSWGLIRITDRESSLSRRPSVDSLVDGFWGIEGGDRIKLVTATQYATSACWYSATNDVNTPHLSLQLTKDPYPLNGESGTAKLDYLPEVFSILYIPDTTFIVCYRRTGSGNSWRKLPKVTTTSGKWLTPSPAVVNFTWTMTNSDGQTLSPLKIASSIIDIRSHEIDRNLVANSIGTVVGLVPQGLSCTTVLDYDYSNSAGLREMVSPHSTTTNETIVDFYISLPQYDSVTASNNLYSVCLRYGAYNWRLLNETLQVTQSKDIQLSGLEHLTAGAENLLTISSRDASLSTDDVLKAVLLSETCLTMSTVKDTQLSLYCPDEEGHGLVTQTVCSESCFSETVTDEDSDLYISFVSNQTILDDIVPSYCAVGSLSDVAATLAMPAQGGEYQFCYQSNGSRNWYTFNNTEGYTITVHPKSVPIAKLDGVPLPESGVTLMGGSLQKFSFQGIEPVLNKSNFKIVESDSCLSQPTGTEQVMFMGVLTQYEDNQEVSIIIPQHIANGAYYLCGGLKPETWWRYGPIVVQDPKITWRLVEGSSRHQTAVAILFDHISEQSLFNTTVGSDAAMITTTSNYCSSEYVQTSLVFSKNLGPSEGLKNTALLTATLPWTAANTAVKYRLCLYTLFAGQTTKSWIEVPSAAGSPFVVESSPATTWNIITPASKYLTGIKTTISVSQLQQTSSPELKFIKFDPDTNTTNCLDSPSVDIGGGVEVSTDPGVPSTKILTFHMPTSAGGYLVCYKHSNSEGSYWVQLRPPNEVAYRNGNMSLEKSHFVGIELDWLSALVLVDDVNIRFSAAAASLENPTTSLTLTDISTIINNETRIQETNHSWSTSSNAPDEVCSIADSQGNCPDYGETNIVEWYPLQLSSTTSVTVSTLLSLPPQPGVAVSQDVNLRYKICLYYQNLSVVIRLTSESNFGAYQALPVGLGVQSHDELFKASDRLEAIVTLDNTVTYNTTSQFMTISDSEVSEYRKYFSNELSTESGFVSSSPILQSDATFKVSFVLGMGNISIPYGEFPYWVVKCPKAASWDDNSLSCTESVAATSRGVVVLDSSSYTLKNSDESCSEEFGWGHNGLRKFTKNGKGNFHLQLTSACPQNDPGKLPNPGCGFRIAGIPPGQNKTLYSLPFWINLEPHSPDSLLLDNIPTTSGEHESGYTKLCVERQVCSIHIQSRYRGPALYSPTGTISVRYSLQDYGVTGNQAYSLVNTDFESTSWAEQLSETWLLGGYSVYERIPILRPGRQSSKLYLNITFGTGRWTRLVVVVEASEPKRLEITGLQHINIDYGNSDTFSRGIPPPIVHLDSFGNALPGSYIDALHPLEMTYEAVDINNLVMETLGSWLVRVEIEDKNMKPIQGNGILKIVLNSTGHVTAENRFTSPSYNQLMGSEIPVRNTEGGFKIRFRVLNNVGCTKTIGGCHITLKLMHSHNRQKELMKTIRIPVRVRGTELQVVTPSHGMMSEGIVSKVFPGSYSREGWWLNDEFSEALSWVDFLHSNREVSHSSVASSQHSQLSERDATHLGDWGSVFLFAPDSPDKSKLVVFQDSWGLTSQVIEMKWHDNAVLHCNTSVFASVYEGEAASQEIKLMSWASSNYPEWNIRLLPEIKAFDNTDDDYWMRLTDSDPVKSISRENPVAMFSVRLVPFRVLQTARYSVTFKNEKTNEKCTTQLHISRESREYSNHSLQVTGANVVESGNKTFHSSGIEMVFITAAVDEDIEIEMTFLKTSPDGKIERDYTDRNFSVSLMSGGRPRQEGVTWKCPVSEPCSTTLLEIPSIHDDIIAQPNPVGSSQFPLKYQYGPATVDLLRASGKYSTAAFGKGYLTMLQFAGLSGLCRDCQILVCPAIVDCEKGCTVNNTRTEVLVRDVPAQCKILNININPTSSVHAIGVVTTNFGDRDVLRPGSLNCGATPDHLQLISTIYETYLGKHYISFGFLTDIEKAAGLSSKTLQVQFPGQQFLTTSGWQSTYVLNMMSSGLFVGALIGYNSIATRNQFILSEQSLSSVRLTTMYSWLYKPDIVSHWALKDNVTGDSMECSIRSDVKLPQSVSNYLELSDKAGAGWSYSSTTASVGIPIPLEIVVYNNNTIPTRAVTFPDALIQVDHYHRTGCNDGGTIRLFELRSQTNITGLDLSTTFPFVEMPYARMKQGFSIIWIVFDRPCQECRLKLTLCDRSSLTECSIPSFESTPGLGPLYSKVIKVLPYKSDDVVITKQNIAEGDLKVGDPMDLTIQPVDSYNDWIILKKNSVYIPAHEKIKFWIVTRHAAGKATRYGNGGFLDISNDETISYQKECNVPEPKDKWQATVSTNSDSSLSITFHHTRPCHKCSLLLYYSIGEPENPLTYVQYKYINIRTYSDQKSGDILIHNVATCGVGWGIILAPPSVYKDNIFSVSVVRVDAQGHPVWKRISESNRLDVSNIKGEGNGEGGVLLITKFSNSSLDTEVVRMSYSRACYQCSFEFGSKWSLTVLTKPTQIIVVPITPTTQRYTSETGSGDPPDVTFAFHVYVADDNFDRAFGVGGPIFLRWQHAYEQGAVVPTRLIVGEITKPEDDLLFLKYGITSGSPPLKITNGSAVIAGTPNSRLAGISNSPPAIVIVKVSTSPCINLPLQLTMSGQSDNIVTRSLSGNPIMLNWIAEPDSFVVVFPETNKVIHMSEYKITVYATKKVGRYHYRTRFTNERTVFLTTDTTLCVKCVFDLSHPRSVQFIDGEATLVFKTLSGYGDVTFIVEKSTWTATAQTASLTKWVWVSSDVVMVTKEVRNQTAFTTVGKQTSIWLQAFTDNYDSSSLTTTIDWSVDSRLFSVISTNGNSSKPNNCFTTQSGHLEGSRLVIIGHFNTVGYCELNEVVGIVRSPAVIEFPLRVTVTEPVVGAIQTRVPEDDIITGKPYHYSIETVTAKGIRSLADCESQILTIISVLEPNFGNVISTTILTAMEGIFDLSITISVDDVKRVDDSHDTSDDLKVTIQNWLLHPDTPPVIGSVVWCGEFIAVVDNSTLGHTPKASAGEMPPDAMCADGILLSKVSEFEREIKPRSFGLVVDYRLGETDWRPVLLEELNYAIVGRHISFRLQVVDDAGSPYDSSHSYPLAFRSGHSPCNNGDFEWKQLKSACTPTGSCIDQNIVECSQQLWNIPNGLLIENGQTEVHDVMYRGPQQHQELLITTQWEERDDLNGMRPSSAILIPFMMAELRALQIISGKCSIINSHTRRCTLPLEIAKNVTAERLRSGVFDPSTLFLPRIDSETMFIIEIESLDRTGRLLHVDDSSIFKLEVFCGQNISATYNQRSTAGITTFTLELMVKCSKAIFKVTGEGLVLYSTQFEAGNTAPVETDVIWLYPKVQLSLGVYNSLTFDAAGISSTLEQALKSSLEQLAIQSEEVIVRYVCVLHITEMSELSIDSTLQNTNLCVPIYTANDTNSRKVEPLAVGTSCGESDCFVVCVGNIVTTQSAESIGNALDVIISSRLSLVRVEFPDAKYPSSFVTASPVIVPVVIAPTLSPDRTPIPSSGDVTVAPSVGFGTSVPDSSGNSIGSSVVLVVVVVVMMLLM